jgi:hypothetical protein
VVGFDIVYVVPPATNTDVTEVAIIDRINNPETILSWHPEKKGWCHPSTRHWDPRYYFSNKYLRNLLNGEKGKRDPGHCYF